MEDRSNPFKKAGFALLVVGIIDMAFMAYAIANKVSYSSSFNILAVIVGILLLRRSAGTARVVRWFSIFLMVAFAGVLVIVPLGTRLIWCLLSGSCIQLSLLDHLQWAWQSLRCLSGFTTSYRLQNPRECWLKLAIKRVGPNPHMLQQVFY